MTKKFECYAFNERGRIRYDFFIKDGEIEWVEVIKFYCPEDELHKCNESNFAQHCEAALSRLAEVKPNMLGQIYHALNEKSKWRGICLRIKNAKINEFGF